MKVNRSINAAILFLQLIFLTNCSKDETPTDVEAEFSPSTRNVTAGDIIVLRGESTGNPTSWEWNISSGTPSFSTEQNPHVAFLTTGNFDVSLKVKNAFSESEILKPEYIFVRPMSEPPYGGTLYIEPNTIDQNDPSTFISLQYIGRETRIMFDLRIWAEVEVEAYIFTATFEGDQSVKYQVNPEFSYTTAESLVRDYALMLGQVPLFLLENVKLVTVHDGDGDLAAGGSEIFVHRGTADALHANGFLEEGFLHEACHTTLDEQHYFKGGWVNARTNDHVFISDYAASNPLSEDVAESFVAYLALKNPSSDIDYITQYKIQAAIPHRIAYFERQDFNLYPFLTNDPD